jgi:hypothetical protein
VEARRLAALNREFLLRLRRQGRPATIGDLFAGSEPAWATDAAARCVAANLVTRDATGRLKLTESGGLLADTAELEQAEYARREHDAGRSPWGRGHTGRG